MHVPDTPETLGMLNESRIAAMKPGAYLVNVTNSSVADRTALAAALAEGRLAGAALDVHEAHPIPPDSRSSACRTCCSRLTSAERRTRR